MIKNKINTFINHIHLILFDSDVGGQMRVFVKNVSLSFSGGMVAFVILFGASIIAARVLGPIEYGKYVVVFSMAQMLSLLFVLELDVSVLYFLANYSKKKSKVKASIILMFFINIATVLFFAVSIYEFMMPMSVSGGAFVGAIFIALSFAAKRMIDAFLRVENLFKRQMIFKILEAIVVIGVLGISFFILEQQGYFSYVWAIALGGVVFVILGIINMDSVITVRSANIESINEVFQYNVFGLIGAIVNGVVKNTDKLVVVSLLGVGIGGVYAVYFTASVIIGARVTQLFINAFFPAVRADGVSVKNVFIKINKLCIKIIGPLVIVASVGVALVVMLYGSQYPFVWSWVILAGVYIAISFFASLYGWLLSSVSRDGYKAYNMSFVYAGIVYGGFLWVVFIMNSFSIMTLLIGLVIYRVVGGLVSYLELREMI